MTRHRTVGALLLASTFLIAGASAAAASSRWTQNAVIPVWIDAVGMPSGAGALVELALKTWTEAAAGRFKLWARRSENRPVRRSESRPLEGGSFYRFFCVLLI